MRHRREEQVMDAKDQDWRTIAQLKGAQHEDCAEEELHCELQVEK